MASSSQAGQTGNERPSALKKANGHVDPLLGSPVQQTPAKKAANESNNILLAPGVDDKSMGVEAAASPNAALPEVPVFLGLDGGGGGFGGDNTGVMRGKAPRIIIDDEDPAGRVFFRQMDNPWV